MNHKPIQKKTDKIVLVIAAVLFVLLCVLTAATINVITNSSSVKSSVPFDLDRVTADKTAEYADVSDILLPSFIGITSDGVRRGVSVSANTVAELYRTITPTLAAILADEYADTVDEDLWNSMAQAENSVYVRYHSEIPDYVVSTFALHGNTTRNSLNSYIYELILTPYSEASDTVTAAVRSADGNVVVYEQSSPEEIITAEDLRRVQRSYRSSLRTFEFMGDSAAVSSPTEPVFLESVQTRNIIITGYSGSLVQNSEEEIEAIMRLFSFNPDKLLNQHEEEDGSTSYIDTKGILYLRNSSFEYTATADGGIPIENYIGYTESVGLMDYIQTAATIFDRITAVSRHYTGGDADITLASVENSGGVIRLTYEYTFDNLKITDIEPAFTVTFEDGMLREAKLYTVAVRNLGDRTQVFDEWWFADHLESRMTDDMQPYRNIGLVYRRDFVSGSVKAEWCAENGGNVQ